MMTNNNKKKEGKWGIDGGTETYLLGERDENFRKPVSQLLSIWAVVPLLLCRGSSATTVQMVKISKE